MIAPIPIMRQLMADYESSFFSRSDIMVCLYSFLVVWSKSIFLEKPIINSNKDRLTVGNPFKTER